VQIATTVIVEVVTTAAWVMSLDRSLPGRLKFIVGCAWDDPANRPAMIAAGRKLMTEDERQATRAAYGLDPAALDDPAVVAADLPADTTGTWRA
jgi:hypothetical protein